jgi:replicative DNA helicase
MAGMPLMVDDTPALTVNEIRRRARIIHLRRPLSLVIVDHLQLAKGEKGARSRNEEVGTITKGLKALAKELNLPVILLSQLNRKFADRTDKRPVLTDLRDSGEIEQDTDIVMFLHRPEVYVTPKRDAITGQETPEFLRLKGQAILDVAKQRNGPTGDVDLTWHARSTVFTNRQEAAF